MSRSELHFRITRRDKISITDIQGAALEAWRQMRQPGTAVHANFVARGLDRVRLPGKLRDVVVVRPDGAGVGTVDVIVVLSGKVALDIWKYVVFPHIRDIWGDDALRRKRAARSAETRRPGSVRKKEIAVSPVETTKIAWLRNEPSALAADPSGRVTPEGK